MEERLLLCRAKVSPTLLTRPSLFVREVSLVHLPTGIYLFFGEYVYTVLFGNRRMLLGFMYSYCMLQSMLQTYACVSTSIIFSEGHARLRIYFAVLAHYQEKISILMI